MRLLIDAQLPRRLARWLNANRHDAIHTLDLPGKNATPDAEVVARAIREERIVVTKDNDFVQSFLLSRRPPRLLLISTGNIRNAELEALLRGNLAAIASAFDSAHFVELARDALLVHE